MPNRALALALVFAALFSVLLGRLFQLQILEGESLASETEHSRVVTEILPAMRGRILDRNGTPIVDNRAAYHAAVILADLEMDWRERRKLPFFRLDEQHMDAFIADLGLRLPQRQDDLRATVLRELLSHPAVAVRPGARAHDQNLTLLAVPRQALAPDQEDEHSGAAVLAEANLVVEDPREALEREVVTRWKQPARCYAPDEFRAAAAALDREYGSTGERCVTVLETFAPVVTLRLDAGESDERTLSWRLFTDERRAQAEAALSRFLTEPAERIHASLEAALEHARLPPASDARCCFAPGSSATEVASLLPPPNAFVEIALGGVPPGRERIVIIQGDMPNQPGVFAQVQARLANSLGAPGPWVGVLIERHAERIRAAVSERDYRRHQLAFDPAALDQLCAGLAGRLTAAGLPTTRLEVEHQVALARRIADKEWTGQTRLDPIVLVRDVPHRLAMELEGAGAGVPKDLAHQYDDVACDLPGIYVQVDAGREYPFPGSASHIIGTLGRAGAEEVAAEEGELEGWRGRSGLESIYEDVLRGTPGKRTRLRTPTGYVTLRKTDDPPIAGHDLATELDMELQLVAENSLNRWFELATEMKTATEEMDRARAVGSGRAGFVMIDCHTGAIIALASSPGYRLDELRTRYSELNDPGKSPGQPLHDHASEAAQPPGSAVKILTALAALQLKVMTPGEEIYSPGYMAMSKAGEKILRDHAPPGTYDLVRAIQYSCNVYFAHVGERVGGDRLSHFFQLFGLGSRNALDVQSQRAGILPTPATLIRWRKNEPHWMVSDSWRMAIGQFLSASPLQVVTIAAAVANGGHVVRPYLVKPGAAPEVIDLDIRKDYLDAVRRGMELVTANEQGSTAKYLQLEGAAKGIKVAAKTGTSEWGSKASREKGLNPDHSWLIGYAPADAPVVAFAVFIHSGTSGGRASSPVAKRILEAYFTKYGRLGHVYGRQPARAQDQVEQPAPAPVKPDQAAKPEAEPKPGEPKSNAHHDSPPPKEPASEERESPGRAARRREILGHD